MDSKYKQMLASKAFKSFVKKKWTVSIILTVIMLLVYFSFISTIAFSKKTLATQMENGITIGIPIGIFIIIISWLLTGVYVNWANKHYDKSVENLKKEL